MKTTTVLLLGIIAAASAAASADIISIPLTSKQRLERARRKHPDSGGDDTLVSETITLTGCEAVDFSAAVTIGQGTAAQTFELIIDTGSSTLAVAGSSCGSGCSGVTPQYQTSSHSSSGATNTDAVVSGMYGDGSGWSGTVWTDAMAMGGYSLPNMAIAVMTSASSFFNSDCNGNSPGPNQGIMGMAYENLAVSSSGGTSTDSFADKWEQVQLGTSPGNGANQPGSLVFSLLLCDTAGSMWLNGYDSSEFSGSAVYVPITLDQYYNVDLNGIQFTDSTGNTIKHTSASSSSAFSGGVTIVDSGTTMFSVPSSVFSDINSYLNTVSYMTNHFGSNFLKGSSCLSSSASIATINANLPWMRLNMDNGVALVLPAISSYMMQSVINGKTYYCPGISSGTDTILGWAVMNNFVTIFDRTNNVFSKGAIGFAPTSSCNTGSTALVLNPSGAPTSSPGTQPTVQTTTSAPASGGSGSGTGPTVTITSAASKPEHAATSVLLVLAGLVLLPFLA